VDVWLQDRIFLGCSGPDQLLNGDRESTNANPGRVPHRVSDCAGRAGDSNLAHPLNAERVHMRVVLFDQDGLERWHIGIHWNVVLGQVRVHDPP